MSFCTVCGTQNPDDARFCAQCGNRLETSTDAPVVEGDPSGESTATINLNTADKAETSDRQLNAVDAAAVDALPSGHALLGEGRTALGAEATALGVLVATSSAVHVASPPVRGARRGARNARDAAGRGYGTSRSTRGSTGRAG